MSPKHLVKILSVAAAAIAITVAAVLPAGAGTTDDKLSAMTKWTQPTDASYAEWNTARLNQNSTARYRLNWDTDYCSNSPDEPLGFDFRLPCWRHDFGYSNFKDMGMFDTNKHRLDESFYHDMTNVCENHVALAKTTCLGLAWVYYQAVSGTAKAVTAQDIENARHAGSGAATGVEPALAR